MRFIYLMIVALILSGCIIDSSASEQPKYDETIDFHLPDIDGKVNHQHINFILEPGRKMYEVDNNSRHIYYDAFTTSEQAAFLVANAEYFTPILNGVEVEELMIRVMNQVEIDGTEVYELSIGMNLSKEQYEKTGSEITTFGLLLDDEPIFSYKHSRVHLVHMTTPFLVKGIYKNSGFQLTNETIEDVQMVSLYIEGVNGVQLPIEVEPQLIKRDETLAIKVKNDMIANSSLQGSFGFYAVLNDGRHLFLGDSPYESEKQKDVVIKQIANAKNN